MWLNIEMRRGYAELDSDILAGGAPANVVWGPVMDFVSVIFV
jgi:hypothetical protein